MLGWGKGISDGAFGEGGGEAYMSSRCCDSGVWGSTSDALYWAHQLVFSSRTCCNTGWYLCHMVIRERALALYIVVSPVTLGVELADNDLASTVRASISII